MARTDTPTRTRLALAALAAALAAPGCSETVLSGNPDAAPPTRVQATVEVQSPDPDRPLLVDFGEVALGETESVQVLIRSVGDDTLQLRDLEIDAPGVTVDPLDDALLAPGAETFATLRWTPMADGQLDGALRVITNDREQPEVHVDLRGDGLGPKLAVFPPAFDFGDLEIGCIGGLALELRNEGRAPLTIDSVLLDEAGDDDEIRMPGTLLLPITLAPGETRVVQLEYEPLDATPDVASVTVSGDDPGGAVVAQQFGVGHLGDTNQDLFEQGGLGLTDILFVVDNSCSMGDEQTTFALNFPAFPEILEESGTDYKLAATTTDSGDNGAFVGSVPVITPSTPDPAGTFGANVNLGTTGSGYEQAMLGGWLALDPSNGVNPNFLRDNAGLRIIFVSDAVDFSTDAGMPFQTPEGYVAAFQGLKDDPSSVILSDISGGLTGCSGPGGSAQGSTNLTTATALTGGISASICDANWVSSLAALAWLSTTINDTFILTQPALEPTVEVRLNGSYVYDGWFFDPALNAVIFNGAYIPDEGDEVIVDYGIAGGCEG